MRTRGAGGSRLRDNSAEFIPDIAAKMHAEMRFRLPCRPWVKILHGQ